MIRRFLNDESGATAIEYALIAGLIFLAIVGAIIPIGASLSETFDEASEGAGVDLWARGEPKPSDHAPVWIKLADGSAKPTPRKTSAKAGTRKRAATRK